jgi:NADH:ubiquinone oxidoreductase subunit H
MIKNADQIFVLLQHWVMSFFPTAYCSPLSVCCSPWFPSSAFSRLCLPSLSCWSAKDWAACRTAIGPNRVGPLGILQPVADGLKSLTKEDIVPTSADAVVHFLAPVFLVVVVFMGYAVLPMGRNMTLVNLDAGLLFFFAMGASTELSVFMAGWSSRNKYSLLGAMRAVAQMISYEVPLLLSSLVVVMMTGSMNLGRIVAVQNQYSWGLPHWYIFTPWGFAAFLLYAICNDRGEQPFAVRFARRRVRAGGGLLHGVLRFQIRAVLSRRVCRHAFGIRPGHDAVPRRLVGSVLVPHLGAVLDLVLRQGDALDLRFYLAARHAAPPAPGSADELCVEVCGAAFADQPVCCRPVEVSWATGGRAGASARRFCWLLTS